MTELARDGDIVTLMPQDVHAVGAELSHRVEGTDKTIAIPDPDQGTRFVQLLLDRVNLMLNVWEPWPDDDPDYQGRGDDLVGFLRRWERWTMSNESFLHFIDPRFGYDHYMPRSVIPHVIDIGIGIHRREDTRAMVRMAAIPVGSGGLPILGRVA